MSIEAAQCLVDLVGRLRPTDLARPCAGVRAESVRLRDAPEEAAAIAAALIELLQRPRQGVLFAEAGVRSALGFWLELLHRLGRRLLPPLADDGPDDLMRRAFHQGSDAHWVAAVPESAWRDLVGALRLGPDGPAGAAVLQALDLRLGEAALMLSCRLAGSSLDRELLRLMPELESVDSPFLVQNRLLNGLLDAERGRLELGDPLALGMLGEMLARCDDAVLCARQRARERGVTIRLSYLLSRLDQLADRLRLLLEVLASADGDRRGQALVKLLCTLVEATETGRSVFVFVADDIRLLARNVTDHASRRGEHYIAVSRDELRHMAAAAAGGGAIIALLALIKLRIGLLHLPPLTEGLLFSLNYGIGFVLIHLLGFSVATKQPAMTAATIAARLDGTRQASAVRFRLLRDILRSQAIAVAGNVAIALPVACLVGMLWVTLFGQSVAPVAKADSLLQELHPLRSGALLFAAIAGVGLFLAGLVSGFFDNQCRYGRFIDRIPRSGYLRWLSPDTARRFARQVDAHYGAVMGNLFFGFFLGMVGESAKLTGIPLDVRHVAFSTANVGMAITVVDTPTLIDAWPAAAAGVAGIALVNLLVSFWLALNVAMLSRSFDPMAATRKRAPSESPVT
jgi:site-specific recombinase